MNPGARVQTTTAAGVAGEIVDMMPGIVTDLKAIAERFQRVQADLDETRADRQNLAQKAPLQRS